MIDSNSSFNPNNQLTQRVVLLEKQMRELNSTLAAYFVKGRLRTDRSAPANSADVQTPDLLYDFVLTPTFVYVLIDNAGTLAWRRITAAAF